MHKRPHTHNHTDTERETHTRTWRCKPWSSSACRGTPQCLASTLWRVPFLRRGPRSRARLSSPNITAKRTPTGGRVDRVGVAGIGVALAPTTTRLKQYPQRTKSNNSSVHSIRVIRFGRARNARTPGRACACVRGEKKQKATSNGAHSFIHSFIHSQGFLDGLTN